MYPFGLFILPVSKENIACLKADVLTDIEQTFYRDFAVKVEHVAVGGSEQIIGILGVYAGVGPSRKLVLVKHKAGVRIRPGVFKGDDFREYLTVNSVLDIPQAIDVRRAVLSARFEVEVVEIGIEVMPQIVLHHAPSVKPVSMRPGGQSAASGI